MKAYVVIDTNVLVSALLAKRTDSAPVQILDRLFNRDFIPMYNDEILAEYSEVLRRPKFKFQKSQSYLQLTQSLKPVWNPKELQALTKSLTRKMLSSTKWPCQKMTLTSLSETQNTSRQ